MLLVQTAGSILVVPSVKYIVCLVLKHPETVAIYRLSMTFYIDNFDVNGSYYATVNAMATRSFGVRYFLLNPKLSEYKLFSNTVQAALPGMLTSVNVRQHLRKRLPAPHGNCVDTVKNYTFESCFKQCYDDQLMDNCQCSGFFLQRDKMCTDASLSQRQLLQNHRCLLQIRGSECALCNERCEDMDYMTTTSHTKWPLPYQYQSFYQELISNKPPYSNRFLKVEDETDESKSSNLSTDALRLIDENFVKIGYYLDYQSYLESVEVPKYTLFSFLGTLGGALNLWTGITVVVVVEIIEVVINVCSSAKKY